LRLASNASVRRPEEGKRWCREEAMASNMGNKHKRERQMSWEEEEEEDALSHPHLLNSLRGIYFSFLFLFPVRYIIYCLCWLAFISLFLVGMQLDSFLLFAPHVNTFTHLTSFKLAWAQCLFFLQVFWFSINGQSILSKIKRQLVKSLLKTDPKPESVSSNFCQNSFSFIFFRYQKNLSSKAPPPKQSAFVKFKPHQILLQGIITSRRMNKDPSNFKCKMEKLLCAREQKKHGWTAKREKQ
jgi:hypothetical protein